MITETASLERILEALAGPCWCEKPFPHGTRVGRPRVGHNVIYTAHFKFAGAPIRPLVDGTHAGYHCLTCHRCIVESTCRYCIQTIDAAAYEADLAVRAAAADAAGDARRRMTMLQGLTSLVSIS